MAENFSRSGKANYMSNMAYKKLWSAAQTAPVPNLYHIIQVPGYIAEIYKNIPVFCINAVPPTQAAPKPEVCVPADQVRFLYSKYDTEEQKLAKYEAWRAFMQRKALQNSGRHSSRIDLKDLFYETFKVRDPITWLNTRKSFKESKKGTDQESNFDLKDFFYETFHVRDPITWLMTIDEE